MSRFQSDMLRYFLTANAFRSGLMFENTRLWNQLRLRARSPARASCRERIVRERIVVGDRMTGADSTRHPNSSHLLPDPTASYIQKPFSPEELALRIRGMLDSRGRCPDIEQGRQRTGWDSNPRYPCGYTGFRDRLLQPLGHLSWEAAR